MTLMRISILKDSLAWRQLRKLAELSFVKSSYAWVFVVPVIAKLLSQIEEKFIDLRVFGYVLSVPTQLPFSWTVLYFSGLSFLVAYVIYLARAPRLIKEYDSVNQFLDDRKNYRHLIEYSEEINTPFESGFRHADLECRGDNIAEEEVVERFWEVHKQANTSNTLSRITCGVFLYAGLSMSTWLIVQNTYYVIRAL